MTVKEFYDYAVKHGLKNSHIIVNYECGDCWYDLTGYTLEKFNLQKGNNVLLINLTEQAGDD